MIVDKYGAKEVFSVVISSSGTAFKKTALKKKTGIKYQVSSIKYIIHSG